MHPVYHNRKRSAVGIRRWHPFKALLLPFNAPKEKQRIREKTSPTCLESRKSQWLKKCQKKTVPLFQSTYCSRKNNNVMMWSKQANIKIPHFRSPSNKANVFLVDHHLRLCIIGQDFFRLAARLGRSRFTPKSFVLITLCSHVLSSQSVKCSTVHISSSGEWPSHSVRVWDALD